MSVKKTYRNDTFERMLNAEDMKYFNRLFKEKTGFTPKNYRSKDEFRN